MAVYVLMLKLEDTKEKVIYKFGPNENHMGIIEFNKFTKEFKILESVEGEAVSSKAYERWAAEKIAKIMYRGDGIFPDRTAVEK